jgi:hypothetical protein
MDILKKLLVSVPFLFMGCATQNYVEPEGPETATLTFQNKSRSDIRLTTFKVAEDCSGGILTFTNNSILPAGKDLSIKVKANHPFSFRLYYTDNAWHGFDKHCRIPATFTAKQGRRYIARFTYTDQKNLICYMSVLSISPAGESKEPTFRIRNQRVPFFDNGPSCD